MRVNDISVSRTHALIKYRANDGIYLSDNKSKFGTLILMRNQAEGLKKDSNYLYQVGRSVISVRIVERSETSNADSDSAAQDELSSAEHGQTEPFCSSESSEEADQGKGDKSSLKRCQSSRDAHGHETTLGQTQNDRDSLFSQKPQGAASQEREHLGLVARSSRAPNTNDPSGQSSSGIDTSQQRQEASDPAQQQPASSDADMMAAQAD